MKIEALNEGSGAPAKCSTPTQSAHSGNKRKERSLTSKAGNQPKKKAQQDSQMVVAQMLQVKDGQPGDQDKGWQTVDKKKKGKLNKKNKSTEKRKPRMLPNALLISSKANTSYADILRKVKKDLPEIDAEGTIKKVRRRTRGQILIVLNRKIGDEMGSLHARMAEVLKEESDVTCKKNEVDKKKGKQKKNYVNIFIIKNRCYLL